MGLKLAASSHHTMSQPSSHRQQTEPSNLSLERMAQRPAWELFDQTLFPSHRLPQLPNTKLCPDDALHEKYSQQSIDKQVAHLQKTLSELKNKVRANPLVVHTYEDMQITALEKMLQQLSLDRTYWYRTIDLDNQEASELLDDPEMRLYHGMYTKTQIESLEFETRRNKILYAQTSWLDYQNAQKLKRRLSFLNRILKHSKQRIPQPQKPGPCLITRTSPNTVRLDPITDPSIQISGTSSSQSPKVNLFADPNHPLHQQFDSLLQMVQIEHPEMFGEYKDALISIIGTVHDAHIRDEDFESYRDAMAYALRQYFHHLQPNNPLENPKEFFINTAKYVGWFLFTGKFQALEKAGLALSQIYELSAVDYSHMTTRARIDAITQQAAEITWMIATDRIVSKTPLKKSLFTKSPAIDQLYSKNQPTTGTHGLEDPHMVTPDGVVIPVAPESADTSVLQSSVAGPSSTSNTCTNRGVSNTGKDANQIPKVSGMKEFFNDYKFGKKLYKNSTKLNQRYNGQAVYRLNNKINDVLKKGYHYYLDSLHFDHIEVFDGYGRVVGVLNLDGSINLEKTRTSLTQNRTIKL